MWDAECPFTTSTPDTRPHRRGAGTLGEMHTDSRRHPATRWAGNLCRRDPRLLPEQAATVIDTWVRNGVLVRTTYTNTNRKERAGLRVDDAKRPT